VKTNLSRQGTLSRPGAAAFLALALACQACSGTRFPTPVVPVVRETEVSVQESVVPAAEIQGRVDQLGSTATFTATMRCDLHRIRTVEQVTLRSRSASRSSGGPSNAMGWVAALIVTSGLAVGSVAIISKAQGRDVANPGAKMVNGVILGALGLGVVGTMIWASASYTSGASGSYKATERVDLDDGLVQANVPCGEETSFPVKAPVTGRLPGPKPVEIALGSLDRLGKLVVNLAAQVPVSARAEAGNPGTMPVYIRGLNVGVVRFDE